MNDLTQLRSDTDIAGRITALAGELRRDYAGRTIDVVCLLGGASVFCADLVRQVDGPLRLHPFGFTSYPAASPSGEVRVTLDVAEPLHGRHVLIVEGIVVSGRTPKYVMDLLRLRQPASLALCALGVKRQALAVELQIAYAAFEFGNEIVVGYGVGEGSEKALPFLASRSRSTA